MDSEPRTGEEDLLDGVASPRVDVDEAEGTCRTGFDYHTRSASEAVIDAASTATGTEPLDLPALYSAIEPERLDAIFRPTVRNTPPKEGTIEFGYAGCRVTVNAHGTVVVEQESGSTPG